MGQSTTRQANCPQCGVNLDKPSRVCPKCGLLIGSSRSRLQDQPKPGTPSRASQSNRPKPQSQDREQPAKSKDWPFSFGKAEEKPTERASRLTPAPAVEPLKAEKEPIEETPMARPIVRPDSIIPEETSIPQAVNVTTPAGPDLPAIDETQPAPAPGAAAEMEPGQSMTGQTQTSDEQIVAPSTSSDAPDPEMAPSVQVATDEPTVSTGLPAPEETPPQGIDIELAVKPGVPVVLESRTTTAVSIKPSSSAEPPAVVPNPGTQAMSTIRPRTGADLPTVPRGPGIQAVSKVVPKTKPEFPAIVKPPAIRSISVTLPGTSGLPLVLKKPVTRALNVIKDRKTDGPPATQAAPKDLSPLAAPQDIPEPPVAGVDKEAVACRPVPAGGSWQLPPIDVLDKPVEREIGREDIEKRAQLIEEALASYGVEARITEINIGPTVTQYGAEPGWDRKFKEIRERDKDGNVTRRLEEVSKTRVKVDRISALANDLALALAASSVRIEAPVPGKSIVGIEVPNSDFGLVSLRAVIESAAFQKACAHSRLALALGKGAGGETVVAELDRMPHLLIAGATGSGKTACLNSIICSLLIQNSPEDVQCIMIDPKRVELVNFNSVPHLVAPVVVDSEKAILALRWLTVEMDNRYQKFAEFGARNIDGYNKNRQHREKMPYIVVIVDELADLMMAASDEVEHTLCRLAQLARATGIHLIVATQRPSVDVVTGLIKANFPTRISFALTSQIDSRTILDSAGAEKLLGRGDMLYMPPDASKPKRLQGTFASDDEIDRLVRFWDSQKRSECAPVKFEEMSQILSAVKGDDDTLLETARQLAEEHKNLSTSFLQRRLRIGYPRAARIMEQLEEEGYGRGAAAS